MCELKPCQSPKLTLVLFPDPTLCEWKVSGDLGPFAWLSWLWVHTLTQLCWNKPQICMIGQEGCMGDSNLFSEQWRCYIPTVSEPYNCAKAVFWLVYLKTKLLTVYNQEYTCQFYRPLSSQEVGINETNLLLVVDTLPLQINNCTTHSTHY